ncbi:MAG TPA: T9SS type A sorting domain-containing protein [Saprospiraceae bacterium]|nr:T9SS type A sorting domain-containing protein [Saprospiraceae bacterium]
MRTFLSITIYMSVLTFVSGQVTFTKDVAPIIYNKCTTCHRPNEIGPFSLTNYDEVASYADMIKYVTSIRYMPPWKADPHFSRFIGERALTDEQIALIAEWVDNGTPYGNASEEPALPVFPTGSQVGTPDLVLHFAEPFLHKGGNEDEYRVFVFPTGLTQNKEISTIELRPGNRKVLHHALFAYDETGSAKAMDDADPAYGYDGFGGFGIDDALGNMFPGYVPGQKPVPYPKGLGQTLPAGADILMQAHYGPSAIESRDSSTINVFFKKEPVERQVESLIFLPIAPFLSGDIFLMPPNTVKTFQTQYTTPLKVSVFAIWPHAHLLNKSYEVFAVHPNGDTTNLIRIPDWDFNWQGVYSFKKFIVLEAGTTVYANVTYDNTTNNPSNPNSPPAWVSWGERTTDEMLFMPINFVFYKQGDENIELDEETTGIEDPNVRFVNHYLAPIIPNPARDEAIINFVLEHPDHITLRVLDMQGRVVANVASDEWNSEGAHLRSIDLTPWAPGGYFVQMLGTNFVQSQKMTVVK